MSSIRPLLFIILLCLSVSSSYAQDKPNIVIVFMDNFGWGEPGFNGGGIVRGAATVILAMGDGRMASGAMHRYLMGEPEPAEEPADAPEES